MATKFRVLSLGRQPIIDPKEGDGLAEDAKALVGLSFGGPNQPLHGQVATWSPVDVSGRDPDYDDQSAEIDRFSIDGGPARTFDAVAT
jgi:hypothetical protein